jgi:hypothetical protein
MVVRGFVVRIGLVSASLRLLCVPSLGRRRLPHRLRPRLRLRVRRIQLLRAALVLLCKCAAAPRTLSG